jgi:hypothetical protein
MIRINTEGEFATSPHSKSADWVISFCYGNKWCSLVSKNRKFPSIPILQDIASNQEWIHQLFLNIIIIIIIVVRIIFEGGRLEILVGWWMDTAHNFQSKGIVVELMDKGNILSIWVQLKKELHGMINKIDKIVQNLAIIHVVVIETKQSILEFSWRWALTSGAHLLPR